MAGVVERFESTTIQPLLGIRELYSRETTWREVNVCVEVCGCEKLYRKMMRLPMDAFETWRAVMREETGTRGHGFAVFGGS